MFRRIQRSSAVVEQAAQPLRLLLERLHLHAQLDVLLLQQRRPQRDLVLLGAPRVT